MEVLERIAFIAFIIFWPVIVSYHLMYLKGAYIHVAFGSCPEKFLHFAQSHDCYRCCSWDLYQLRHFIETTAEALEEEMWCGSALEAGVINKCWDFYGIISYSLQIGCVILTILLLWGKMLKTENSSGQDNHSLYPPGWYFECYVKSISSLRGFSNFQLFLFFYIFAVSAARLPSFDQTKSNEN